MTPDDKQKLAQLLVEIHKLSEGIDKLMTLEEETSEEYIKAHKILVDNIVRLKKAIDVKYTEALVIVNKDI